MMIGQSQRDCRLRAAYYGLLDDDWMGMLFVLLCFCCPAASWIASLIPPSRETMERGPPRNRFRPCAQAAKHSFDPVSNGHFELSNRNRWIDYMITGAMNPNDTHILTTTGEMHS